MRATRILLGLALVGLALACEPDPADLAIGTVEPALSLHASTMGYMGLNMGATVNRNEIGCRIPDGVGEWFPDDGWTLPCTMEIATNSKNMNAMIIVKASGVPNPTGRTVRWGPFNTPQVWADGYAPDVTEPPYPCFLLGPDYDLANPLYTINWWSYVTPSGEAKLVCHYQKKWEFQWPG
jgi:hypothetical protein